MKTPICDFVKKYSGENSIRLHMPGHKGKGIFGELDITEIPGADDLSCPAGIIAESEKNAGRIFGARTLYSTEGSSLCIRAMLFLAALMAREQGKSPLVISPRNAHKSFITACGLLDIPVGWVYPEDGDRNWYITGGYNAESIRKALESNPGCTAVYITSPDYLGNVADIRAISGICREHGALLLVDNAHGAYLKFFGMHPVDLGADMCCDSAHKTLPVITGGAYLHISENAPAMLRDSARQAMNMFSTTSPSYLILQSLDEANRTVSSQGYAQRLRSVAGSVEDARAELRSLGMIPVRRGTEEPLKLTLEPGRCGHTGNGMADLLRKNGIVCEFSDRDSCVMMFSASNSVRDAGKVLNVIKRADRLPPMVGGPDGFSAPEKRMSLREALTSPFEIIGTGEEAMGRVVAFPSVSCPPAVSVAVPGEVIDEFTVSCLRYYSIEKISVVK